MDAPLRQHRERAAGRRQQRAHQHAGIQRGVHRVVPDRSGGGVVAMVGGVPPDGAPAAQRVRLADGRLVVVHPLRLQPDGDPRGAQPRAGADAGAAPTVVVLQEPPPPAVRLAPAQRLPRHAPRRDGHVAHRVPRPEGRSVRLRRGRRGGQRQRRRRNKDRESHGRDGVRVMAMRTGRSAAPGHDAGPAPPVSSARNEEEPRAAGLPIVRPHSRTHALTHFRTHALPTAAPPPPPATARPGGRSPRPSSPAPRCGCG